MKGFIKFATTLVKVVFCVIVGGSIAVVAILHKRLPKGPELRQIVMTPQVVVAADAVKSKEAFLASANCLCGREVVLTSLPAAAVPMLLYSEDRRFHQHRGIDYFGMVRGMARSAVALVGGGGAIQGASTIHQQLAGRTVVGRERDEILKLVVRKLREGIVARLIAQAMTPEEVLSTYFEKMPFGSGDRGSQELVGIHDAATYHFGRSDASKLDPAELGALIVSLRASTALDPSTRRERAKRRVGKLLEGMITSKHLKANVLSLLDRPRPPGEAEHHAADMRWYLDAAYGEIVKAVPATATGTLRVNVTLDPSRQRHLEAAVRSGVQAALAARADAAAAVTVAEDGAVLAIVGGADFGQTQFNVAVRSPRPIGSTFKPFVYAAAFEADRRLTPESVVIDRPTRIGDWEPRNSNSKFVGSTTVRNAFAKSINTIAVQLGVNVGIDRVTALAKRMGVAATFQQSAEVLLGSVGATPLSLAVGYVPFVAAGRHQEAHFITRVVGQDGVVIYRQTPVQPPLVLHSSTVRRMAPLFGDAIKSGTGTYASGAKDVWGGKTGTTTGSRDAWFVGLQKESVTAVWVGRLDNKEMASNASGGSLAAPIFRSYTLAIERENLPARRMSVPSQAPTQQPTRRERAGV